MTATRAKRLRKQTTFAEKAAWKTLKQIPDAHFRRQAPLGPYVFDFIEHGWKLVLEVDGGVHRLPEVAVRDAKKERFAREHGYRVVRVSNDEAIEPETLLSRVEAVADTPHPLAPSSQGGGGNP